MNPHPLVIAKGKIVGIRGTARRCRITQIVSCSKVGVRDIDGEQPPEEIAVELLTPPPPVPDPLEPYKPKIIVTTTDQILYKDLASIDDADWDEAKFRLGVIKPLLSIHHPPTEIVKMRADEYGYHWGTLYDWIARFKNSNGQLIALVDHSCSVPKGTYKLHADIETLLTEAIEEHHLTRQRKKVNKVFEALQLACAKKGIKLVRESPGDKLCCPHINTVRARIHAITARRRILEQEGEAEASKHTSSGEGFVVRYPLEYVQIDHTKLDIILICGKTGRRLGRPWLTIIIDVFSRMVLAFYISFDPPGALATGICFAQAILPKENWLRRRAHYFKQMPEWPCFGKPVHAHSDNAREFRGKMLARACDAYLIGHTFRVVRRPHYGAHIERLMGTIATELKSLPGATFSNPKERGKNYDSEKKADMTYEDFDQWFSNLILCKYHYRVHSTLGMSPLERLNQAYTEGTELALPLGELPDRFVGEAAEKLQLDFLPVEERKITEQGVVIDLIRYSSAALTKWRYAKDPKRPGKSLSFIFRYDPRDLSYIYFWNEPENRHEKIPYRDIERPAVTRWEWRAAREFLIKRGTPKRQHHEAMVFEAVGTMRDIVEAAAARKGKLKAAGMFRPGVHRGRLESNSAAKQPKPSTNEPIQGETYGTTDTYKELEVVTELGQ